MAARSGGGTGMVVAIVILSVLTLGLFVTTIVFFSQKQGAERKLEAQATEYRDFVRDDERRNDAILRVQTEAKGTGNKSVVGYMVDSMATVMRRVTGDKNMTLARFEKELERIPGADSQDLFAVVRALNGKITSMDGLLKDAVAARDQAQVDRQNEVKRVGDIEAKQRETLASLTAEIDKYKDEVEKYREDLNVTKAKMDQEIDKTREAARGREAELVGQIREAQEKEAIARETVKRLQEQLRGKTMKPDDEYALVDARVVGSDAASGQYFIDIGRKQKAVLGMTFQVYSEAGTIRPDPRTGDYPAGKATLEVIKVEENSATCRLVRETKGNPVVKGDVIANAIYDPNKTYRLLIYGNFDANGDGIFTPQEQGDIEALVREWGGTVVTELSGDVDFLVLGVKPTLGPPPPPTSPPAVVTEYVRQRQVVQRYERLFNQAEATSIPIINENRLRTLTGMGARR